MVNILTLMWFIGLMNYIHASTWYFRIKKGKLAKEGPILLELTEKFCRWNNCQSGLKNESGWVISLLDTNSKVWNLFSTGLGEKCERDTECIIPSDRKQETVWCYVRQCACKPGFKRDGNRCGELRATNCKAFPSNTTIMMGSPNPWICLFGNKGLQVAATQSYSHYRVTLRLH
jgi:hypothetical protein